MTKIADPTERGNARVRKACGFTFLSKNFCNYPISRDRRSRLTWRRSSKSERWLSTLSPQRGKRIQLRLPRDAPEKHRHAPSAFDMNVLLLLSAAARKWQTRTIDVRSRSDLLKQLGVSGTPRNHARIAQALQYWTTLSIWFERWYHPIVRNSEGMQTPPRHDRQLLRPPIEAIARDARGPGFTITLSRQWKRINRVFTQRVRLPLPQAAAAQNLLLCALVSYTHGEERDDDTRTRWLCPRRRGAFCRKIGVQVCSRALDAAVELAQGYFARGGKSLELLETHDGRISFIISQPVSKPTRPTARPKPTKRPATKPKRPVSAPEPVSEQEIRMVETFDEAGHRYPMYELPDGRLLDYAQLTRRQREWLREDAMP